MVRWRWATISSESRLGVEGQQAINKLTNAVDERVRDEVAKANLTSQRLGVKNLAVAGDSILKLKGFAAQAFDGKTFLPKDRCWRCRLTFGFTWLWPEKDAKDLNAAEIRDLRMPMGQHQRYQNRWSRKMRRISSVVELDHVDDTTVSAPHQDLCLARRSSLK